MSDSIIESNVKKVISFYDAFNSCNLEAFDSLLSHDWINHPADPGHDNTPTGFKAGVTDFHKSFIDFKIVRDAIVAQNDLVVCRISMSGKHVENLGDWLADGKIKKLYGMDMHRLVNGKIVETWHFERVQ